VGGPNVVASTTVMFIDVLNSTTFDKTNLATPFRFALSFDTGNTPDACAYYDAADTQTWRTDGCTLVPVLGSATTMFCDCSHMTDFAGTRTFVTEQSIVPSIQSRTGEGSLNSFSLPGIIIAIVILTIFLLLVCCLSRLHTYHHFILANLAVNLIFSFALYFFWVDSQPSTTTDNCTVITVFLHYILLVAFFWLLFDGIYLWKIFHFVGQYQFTYKHYWTAALTSYLTPVVIVGVALAVLDFNTYKGSTVCWLALSHGTGPTWLFIPHYPPPPHPPPPFFA
jgi:hypothetical protein